MTDELLLIDLSGIAHMIYHTDTNNPDPSRVSTQTIARVRALASEHPHAAICCDSGRSFRADIDPTYKANRDTENRAPLRHQMDLACETLKGDGFVVWAVPGLEADDLIATAVHEAMAIDGATVLIVSSDKDLLQLVSERVRVKSLVTGNTAGPAEVFDLWGVRPDQMGDLLALMGDKSDNIVGVEKIGKTIGARLLSEHGTLEALYGKMGRGMVSGVTPAMRTNLMAFQARWPIVRKLIALRTDAPIELSEIASERVARPMVEEQDMNSEIPSISEEGAVEFDGPERVSTYAVERELAAPESALAAQSALQQAAERIRETAQPQPAQGEQRIMEALKTGADAGRAAAERDARAGAMMPYAAPVDFSQQLEPRNMQEAVVLADRMYQSRLFGAYGTPQAVLSVIMRGREFGMPAMASLAGHHIIDGKACQSADTIAGIVLASGKAKYFKPLQRSATAATFKTLRKGDDEDPFELTYTIEEARLSWQKDQKAWDNSRWVKGPADMLVARAKAKLARLIYPDVVGGLYAVEEME